MKKLLLGLGTLSAIVAPMVAVIGCGTTQRINSNEDETNPSLETNPDVNGKSKKQESPIAPNQFYTPDGIRIQHSTLHQSDLDKIDLKTVVYNKDGWIDGGFLYYLFGTPSYASGSHTKNIKYENGILSFDRQMDEEQKQYKIKYEGAKYSDFNEYFHKQFKIIPVADGGNHWNITNDEVDSLISKQAAAAVGIEKVEDNTVRFGGPNITLEEEGTISLSNGYDQRDRDPKETNTEAELRPGDHIDFIFQYPSDIKKFSQYVRYIDEALPYNFNQLHKGDIYSGWNQFENPYAIKDGKVIAKPVETSATDKGQKESIFTLSTPKQNVVRMTINDIFHGAKQFMPLQSIDFSQPGNTKSIHPFILDNGKLPDEYKPTTKMWAGDAYAYHDEDIISARKVIIEERAKEAAAKAAKHESMYAFDNKDVTWLTKPVDVMNIMPGDIVEFSTDKNDDPNGLLSDAVNNIDRQAQYARIIKIGGRYQMLDNKGQLYELSTGSGDSIKVVTDGKGFTPVDKNNLQCVNILAEQSVGSSAWGDLVKLKVKRIGFTKD